VSGNWEICSVGSVSVSES